MRFCSNWMFPWVSWRKFLQIRNTCSAIAEACWVPPCPRVGTGSRLRVLSGALAWRKDHKVHGQRLSPSLWPFSFCRTPPPQSHFVYFILVCFVFWDSLLLNSSGWPGTFSPPASVFPVHPWLSEASLNRSHDFSITIASTPWLDRPGIYRSWQPAVFLRNDGTQKVSQPKLAASDLRLLSWFSVRTLSLTWTQILCDNSILYVYLQTVLTCLLLLPRFI